MRQTVKQDLFSMIVIIFLLAACAPASIPTQDPAQVQFIKESAARTVSAFNENATQTQASLPTWTPTSGFTPIKGSLDKAAASPTPTPTSGPATATLSREDQDFETFCKPLLDTQTALGEIESKNPLPSKLGAKLNTKQTAEVKEPVNLRTQPSRLSRIIMVLKPGTKVDVIGGPKRTRLGYGITYVWWKVQVWDGDKITDLIGWAVELSACRQYYFIE